jgi:hypothetical protein
MSKGQQTDQSADEDCRVLSFGNAGETKRHQFRVHLQFVASMAASAKIGDSLCKARSAEVMSVNPQVAFWEGIYKIYKVKDLHVRAWGDHVVGYVITAKRRYRIDFDWARGFKLKSVSDDTGAEYADVMEACRFLNSPRDAELAIAEVAKLL